eukprot:9934183-Alexandrium_andersonii.AAC.1
MCIRDRVNDGLAPPHGVEEGLSGRGAAAPPSRDRPSARAGVGDQDLVEGGDVNVVPGHPVRPT